MGSGAPPHPLLLNEVQKNCASANLWLPLPWWWWWCPGGVLEPAHLSWCLHPPRLPSNLPWALASAFSGIPLTARFHQPPEISSTIIDNVCFDTRHFCFMGSGIGNSTLIFSDKHFGRGRAGRPNGISDSDFRSSIFHLLDSDVCYRTLPLHNIRTKTWYKNNKTASKNEFPVWKLK